MTYVTQVHDFTPKIGEMKRWLDDTSASGGGDAPEAVADALHQVRASFFYCDSFRLACTIFLTQ